MYATIAPMTDTQFTRPKITPSIFIRSTLFNIAMPLWTVIFGIGALPTLLKPRDKMVDYVQIWVRGNLWLMRVLCGIKYEIRGAENLPRMNRAYIASIKHQSTVDTVLAGLVFDQLLVIHKQELTYLPVYGWYLKWADMISINRAKGKEALRQVYTQINKKMFAGAGRPLVIFPEGTRTPVGADTKYKSGIYKIQSEFDLPVYPVALNSGVFWGRKAYFKFPGTIVFSILPKLDVPTGATHDVFMKTLKATTESETAKLIAEFNPNIQKH